MTSGRRREVKAHRAIVGGLSSLFMAMVYDNLAKGANEPIQIEETNLHAFEALVKYAYSGQITLQWDELAELLRLSLSCSIKLAAYTKGFVEAAYHYPDILENIWKKEMEETLMAGNG
ncbi:hypothetical protein ACP70R_009364 [Stipagrostis hirtigluma subsp. patula]